MRVLTVLAMMALLAVCMSLAAAATTAYPTFEGATGVVTLPTAEVASQGTISLAANYQRAAEDWNGTFLRINWGATKNLELSAARTIWDGPWGDGWEKIWQGGLKYQVPMSFANVAVGGSFGRDKEGWAEDSLDITKAYLAVSKDMNIASSINARLTGGVMYGKFESDDWSEKFTKPYVALELMHTRGVTLAVEYRWRDSKIDDHDVVPLSTVLRITAPDKPVWVEVGTTNMSDAGTAWDNQRGFIGIGCAFDGK
jgi:hypothetical protein